MIVKSAVIILVSVALLIQTACGGSSEERTTPEGRANAAAEGDLSLSIIRVAPSLEEVRSALKLKLTSEMRTEGELSPLFEHPDLGGLTDSALILFPGNDGAVVIDLARYDSKDVATQAWEQTSRDEVESTSVSGRLLKFTQLGERSSGRIYPPSAGNEFTTTVVLVQLGRVVFAVTVLSNDSDGLSRGAESVARAIADDVVDSRLSLSGSN